MSGDLLFAGRKYRKMGGTWMMHPTTLPGFIAVAEESTSAMLDEIERLRAERDAERDLADQLASHLEWALRCVGSLPMELRMTFDNRMAEVLAAHKEARRER